MTPIALPTPLAIAYSGGADSTALLMMCAQQFPGQVCAVHVHHGLQAAADDFEQHAQMFCQQLDVPFLSVRVHAQAKAGESPEDAARKARYGAIASLIFKHNQAIVRMEYGQGAMKFVVNNIALGQHADDQVETLLLALSRGAGLAGLSGMPAQFEREGLTWHRPFLQMAGRDIRRWLTDRGLTARHPGSPNIGQGWVEDPTNLDMRFTRNRIRGQLMPALASAFPSFRQTFARSAMHAAKAQTLLDEMAVQDLHTAGQPPQIVVLQTLSHQRQANVLRHWLKASHRTIPTTAQLAQLQAQITACTTRAHQIHLKVASGFVQRRGQVLEYLP